MAKNLRSSRRKLELTSTMEAAERLCSELLEEAKEKGFEEEDLYAIHLALVEAYVNSIEDGNHSAPS